MLVDCTCLNCNKSFRRHDYNLNNNGKASKKKFEGVFCSKDCNDFYRYKADLNKDQFTGFRQLLRSSHSRGKEHTLTLEEMKDVWDEQKGICPYTGLSLLLVTRKAAYKQTEGYKVASLDRIDSTKGYIKNNIQFVSIMANYAKHRFSNSTMVEFCKAVALHWREE